MTQRSILRLVLALSLLLGVGLTAGNAKASSCPPTFCTTAQRQACAQTCHNHGIGLVCDFSTCTSQCICGSILPG
jgi:hypothetical protein